MYIHPKVSLLHVVRSGRSGVSDSEILNLWITFTERNKKNNPTEPTSALCPHIKEKPQLAPTSFGSSNLIVDCFLHGHCEVTGYFIDDYWEVSELL